MLYVVDQALPKTDFLTQIDTVGWVWWVDRLSK